MIVCIKAQKLKEEDSKRLGDCRVGLCDSGVECKNAKDREAILQHQLTRGVFVCVCLIYIEK